MITPVLGEFVNKERLASLSPDFVKSLNLPIYSL